MSAQPLVGVMESRERHRVIIASDFFHPVIGGTERQVGLLAAELGRRGHHVRVVTVRQTGQAAEEVIDGVAVHRLRALSTSLPMASSDPGRRFIPPAPDPELALGMRRLLQDEPADLVHANGWIAYAAATAAALSGTPVLLSVRDYGYSCAVRTLLQRGTRVCSGPGLAKCLDCAGRQYGAAKGLAAVSGIFSGRPLLRHTVRGIHSVSRYVEAVVRRDLLRGDPAWRPVLARIPDIVPDAAPVGDAGLSEADAALLARLPQAPFILFVGALQRHKGLDVLLEAYDRLTRARGGDAVPPLVLIGTRWPGTPARFPDGVTVLSDVPHAVVMAAWERSLFGVAPSVWPDPLPGVVREAMTRARPVIATSIGGNTDMIVDGETGMLVRPGDAGALATAMARMLDDPKRRDRLGDAARRSIGGLSAGAIAGRFEELYAAVVRAT